MCDNGLVWKPRPKEAGAVLNQRRYRNPPVPQTQPVRQLLALELAWPLPLIAVGLWGTAGPMLVGAAVALALLPWLARLAAYGRPTRPAVIGGSLALLGLSAGQSLWSAYDPTLSRPMLLVLLGSLGLFFAIINAPHRTGLMAAGLVLAAGLAALYFAGQYEHFHYLDETGWPAGLGRLSGSYLPDLVFFVPHPNAVAAVLEGALPLSLALAWPTQRSRQRLWWGLAGLLLVYGLVVSGSRGAWVGLAAALGLWLLAISGRGLRLVLAGLVAAGVALGLYASQRPDLLSLPAMTPASVLETAHSRLALYRNSLYLVTDYPFTGIGLGDVFAMVYSRYQLLIQVPFLTYSHNLFLSITLAMGLPGLAAFIWLLAAFYRFVFQVERAGGNGQDMALFRASWLGASAIFIHGLVDAPQFAAPGWTMPMLFALPGLAVAAGRQVTEPDRAAYPYRPWLAGAGLAGLLLAFMVWQRPVVGAWYANIGAIYQTRAELAPGLDETERQANAGLAVAYFERALNWEPAQPAANRRFGLMALDHEMFEIAVTHLELAYRGQPGNQATLKSLGLAYLWTGQLDRARELLQQLDDQAELVEELNNWRRWWETNDRAALSLYAGELVQQLGSNNYK